MAEEALAEEGGGLVFHPMDQFIVKPLFGGDGDPLVHSDQRYAVDGACGAGVAVFCVLGTRHRAVVPGRIQSIAELGYGFIYKMVEDVAGKDGDQVLPLHHDAVPVHRFCELPWAAPDGLYHNKPHCGHGSYGDGGVSGVTILGFCLARCFVPEPVLDQLGALAAAPDPGPDRAHFLLRAPGQPFHSSGRQHDGRSRGDQGFRGLSHAALRHRAGRASSGDHRDLCA